MTPYLFVFQHFFQKRFNIEIIYDYKKGPFTVFHAISILITSLRTEHCPSGIYSFGAHSGSLPPSSGDISNPISRRLVNTSPRPSSFITAPVNTLNMVGLKLNKAKFELEPAQDIQFLGLQLRLDQGRASLPISEAREIIAHACQISSQTVHPTGSVTHEALQQHFHSLGLTYRFTPPSRPDPLVLATLLRQWQDPSFLTSGILHLFQVEFTIFTDACTQGWDFQIAGVWTRL